MLARHIQYFLAVAEHRSFTQAAHVLHVSQPALSQQVRQLEENLGVQLFDRSGRHIQLTDAGQVYWRYAQSALQTLQEGQRALHDVSDLSRGSLRLALTPTFTTYLLGPLIEAFHAHYPAIGLHIQEMTQDEMESQLNAGALDIGIAFKETHSNDIQALPLLTENLALVVNHQHPLAQYKQVQPRVLQGQRLALLDREFTTREQIDRYCRQQGISLTVVMEANATSAVIEVVRRTSLGTLLPSTLAQVYTDLAAIHLNGQPLARTAALLLRHNAYHSFATQAFIQTAQTVAKEWSLH